VGPRNHVLDGGPDHPSERRLSGPLKTVVIHCCGVRSKKINNGLNIISATAAADCLVPTGWYHINFSREKYPCGVASSQNSLFSCLYISLTSEIEMLEITPIATFLINN